MISSNTPFRIPVPVEDRLRDVQGARDKTRLAEAVALGLLTLFVAMFAAMFVDWTFTLFDSFWRTVLTLSSLSVAVLAFAAAAFVGLGRNRRLAQVAVEVDRTVPQTQERWSTVAELAAAPLDQQRRIHAGMLRRLSQESTRLVSDVATDEVVSLRGLMRIALGLCAMIVVLLVACLMDWQQTSVLVARFWAPQADVSATRLDVSPTGDVAARGEPLVLQAAMQGRLVESGTLFLRSGDAVESERIAIEATGDQRTDLVHRIKSADESLAYRMRAGDGQSAWQSVVVVDRPQIAAVRFQVTPPAYTGQAAVTLNELPEKATAVEGSRLEVSLLPRTEVTHVVFQGDDKQVDELTTDDGRWYRFQTLLDADMTLGAVLTEEHGLENKHPPVCRIRVVPDKSPTVEIVSPTEETAARPDDEIDVGFSASDDFGIAKAELVVYDEDSPDGTPHERQVIEIPLGDQQGAANVHGSVPLDLKPFALEDGQTLKYAVRVYDTRHAVASSGQPPSSQPPPANATAQAKASDDRAKPQVDQPLADKTGPADKAPTDGAADSSRRSPPQTPARSAPRSQSSRPSNVGAVRESRPSASPASSPPDDPVPSAIAKNTPEAAKAREDRKSGEPSASEPDATATASTSSRAPPDNDVPPTATADNGSVPPVPPGQPPETSAQQTGAPRPPDHMTKRTLDVAQSATSSMMTLHIDKWSGSFAGQQRRKLEMTISPRLQELDQLLEVAENRQREALDILEADALWSGAQDRLLHQADEQIDQALELIADLLGKSAGTAYAFVGLQLGEIGETHLVPAGESLQTGLRAGDNAARRPPVEFAWQQTARARQRLSELTSHYERIRREHHLADAVEQVKTMYQAFVEDSFALLTKDKDGINDYQRRMAQFELDAEYLRRLEEVLKMRQKLIAEFARLLSEDPRLLRRFVDSINNQSETLRDQLTLLALRQQELDGEVQAWQKLTDEQRLRALDDVVAKKLKQSIDLAQSAARLQEAFDTWSPLELGANDTGLAAVREELAAVAAAARKVENQAAAWRPSAESIKASDVAEPDVEPSDEVGDAAGTLGETDGKRVVLADVTAQGHGLHERLLTLDAKLLDLSAGSDQPALGPFVVRRLAQTRRLIAAESAWVYQLERLDAEQYHLAASVEQHQIARETNELAASLADLEQQLAGLLQRDDGTLPAGIAELSRELLTTLDERVAASQLGAVFSLRRDEMPAAAGRTRAATEGLAEAERLFDELIKRAIDEADKLPVQDPIADLLDDPTLDELLALLENEQDLAAALGVPPRPSNLKVIGDFLRPGGGSLGGRAGMVTSQLNSGQRMMKRASQRARNRAEAEADTLASRPTRQVDRWNVLVSELENRLLQGQGQEPPERYRRAIEQYFSEITRGEYDDEAP